MPGRYHYNASLVNIEKTAVFDQRGSSFDIVQPPMDIEALLGTNQATIALMISIFSLLFTGVIALLEVMKYRKKNNRSKPHKQKTPDKK